MNVFGGLIQNTCPEGISLADRACFLGMGFGCEGVPIDIVALFLAGADARSYSILLVDEFQRFNNVPEEHIRVGLKRTRDSLRALERLYNIGADIIISSDFMGSDEYKDVLHMVREYATDKYIEDLLLETVPEKHRENENSLEYPLNEIACVEFLRRKHGYEVKLGPSKEMLYDKIIRYIEIPISFGYVIDAYALGTQKPEKVVHYIPSNRGIGGQRLFLDDMLPTASAKLLLGPEEASRYLLRVASAAGIRLGHEYLTEKEIVSLQDKRLKKTAKRLVMNNILEPYMRVVE